MNRKKPKRKSTLSGRRSSSNATSDAATAKRDQEVSDNLPDPSSRSPAAAPGQTLRTILSLWLSFHLLAIAISFTGVVEPSSVHARLIDLVHPYLRPAHFSADDRPVYLTHGDPSEQPFVLQASGEAITDMSMVDSYAWKEVGPPAHVPGLAASDRATRWLSTAAMLAENDQPGLVADLLLPVVVSDSSIRAIRILRLPTDLSDVNAEAETPYVAGVIRTGDRVSLVQLSPPRLSSRVVSAEGEVGDE